MKQPKNVFLKRGTKKNVSFATKITEETKKQLEKLSQVLGESQSEIISDLIQEAYEQHFGNPQLVTMKTAT